MKLVRKQQSIYTYDDAPDVLRNKLNIKDFDTLQSIERDLVFNHEQQIRRSPNCIGHDLDFSLGHFCAIHKYMFEELYDWAGELRVTNINKRGGDTFCNASDIRRKFDILHRELKYANYFKDIDSDEDLPENESGEPVSDDNSESADEADNDDAQEDLAAASENDDLEKMDDPDAEEDLCKLDGTEELTVEEVSK